MSTKKAFVPLKDGAVIVKRGKINVVVVGKEGAWERKSIPVCKPDQK